MKVGESKRLFLWAVVLEFVNLTFCVLWRAQFPSDLFLVAMGIQTAEITPHTHFLSWKKAGEKDRQMISETSLWCVLRVKAVKFLGRKFVFYFISLL